MSSSRGSSEPVRHEGSRFSRCFPPLEPKLSLQKTLTRPIPRTVGVQFQERFILYGNSSGLSPRRNRNESIVANENTKIMTAIQQNIRVRCPWATSELNIPYHDEEWGVPVHDEHTWFEFLILEGAQAGLSWDTILRKRARYREVFDGFDAARVARYGDRKVAQLLADPGIVRNRLKIASTIQNAKAFLAVQKEFGSFDAYLWKFVGGKPITNQW